MLHRGPRGTAQHQALAPAQAAALRRRRERRTLAATLARSSAASVLWAGVVSMTPPGRAAAAPALLAVVALDRHSPARRYARTVRALLATQGGWPRSIQVTTRSYALYHRCARCPDSARVGPRLGRARGADGSDAATIRVDAKAAADRQLGDSRDPGGGLSMAEIVTCSNCGKRATVCPPRPGA
jgi:hypothetical protein